MDSKATHPNRMWVLGTATRQECSNQNGNRLGVHHRDPQPLRAPGEEVVADSKRKMVDFPSWGSLNRHK